MSRMGYSRQFLARPQHVRLGASSRNCGLSGLAGSCADDQPALQDVLLQLRDVVLGDFARCLLNSRLA